MKAIITVLIFCLFLLNCFAQNESITESKKYGNFSFGIRSTQSLFGSSGYPGLGFGGQFKIRLGKKLNTEWFADHIKTDIGGLGHRETAHIGWSVMFYPFNNEFKKSALIPYFLAGHCFDFAIVKGYQNTETTGFETKRWSSAVQAGIGASFFITDRFDISFSTQYMSHLGNDLHVKSVEPLNQLESNYLSNDTDHEQLTLEGHLLLTFSLNYILAGNSKPKS